MEGPIDSSELCMGTICACVALVSARFEATRSKMLEITRSSSLFEAPALENARSWSLFEAPGGRKCYLFADSREPPSLHRAMLS